MKGQKMERFPIYTIESAPEPSKPALQSLKAAFGVVPNIAGAMATSPVLINSLVGLFQQVHGGGFAEAQIQSFFSPMPSQMPAPGRSRFIQRSH